MASQILRHSLNTDEFAITTSDSRTLEPVAKQANYSAGLSLWAFYLNRRSHAQCIARLQADQQAAHESRPLLDLAFVCDPDFYTRWARRKATSPCKASCSVAARRVTSWTRWRA